MSAAVARARLLCVLLCAALLAVAPARVARAGAAPGAVESQPPSLAPDTTRPALALDTPPPALAAITSATPGTLTFAASSPAAAPPSANPGFRLTRADAWYGVATVAAVAIAAQFDQHVTDQMPENPSDAQRRFSDLVRPFGSPSLLVPAAAVVWGGGWLAHAPNVQDAATRSLVSVGAAGVVTGVIKYSVGRKRPHDSPHDSHQFDPFSGNESFPSGHATLAFAAARALDRETTTLWVPVLGYPLAAMCGYSRILERRHWLSDVVAGAAIGWWTADKAEDWQRHRWPAHMPGTVALTIEPGAAATMVGVRATF